jgi:hypothetical protein
MYLSATISHYTEYLEAIKFDFAAQVSKDIKNLQIYQK